MTSLKDGEGTEKDSLAKTSRWGTGGRREEGFCHSAGLSVGLSAGLSVGLGRPPIADVSKVALSTPLAGFVETSQLVRLIVSGEADQSRPKSISSVSATGLV